MAAPDIFDVLEAILGWLEPDPTIAKDPAYAPPPKHQVDTLYLYPTTEAHTSFETGPGIRQDFQLTAELVVPALGEQRGTFRDAEVTAALRARARLYADRVRLNQHGTKYDYLRTAGIDWQTFNGLDYRGIRVRLEGYRLWG